MDSEDLSFLPLKVIRVGANGKRTYDPEGKRRLIEWCRSRPKISISRMALKAGVNTNQLHKWLRDANTRTTIVATLPEPSVSAFVPVTIDASASARGVGESLPVPRELSPSLAVPRAHLSARLPNGVVIDLECASQDAQLVKAVIVALGVS